MVKVAVDLSFERLRRHADEGARWSAVKLRRWPPRGCHSGVMIVSEARNAYVLRLATNGQRYLTCAITSSFDVAGGKIGVFAEVIADAGYHARLRGRRHSRDRSRYSASAGVGRRIGRIFRYDPASVARSPRRIAPGPVRADGNPPGNSLRYAARAVRHEQREFRHTLCLSLRNQTVDATILREHLTVEPVLSVAHQE